MRRYFYNPPGIVKRLFNDFKWRTSCGRFLVTFDDGPSENTPALIEHLEKYKIKALFFCTGENAEKYPDLTARLTDAGHVIANHTHNHKSLLGLSGDEIDFQLRITDEIIERLTGEKPKYFRPPYGKFSLSLSKHMKRNALTNVMWSLLTYDFKNDLKVVKFAVSNYLKKDSIVVFHDNTKCSDIVFDAIDFLMEKAESLNLEPGEPEECLK